MSNLFQPNDVCEYVAMVCFGCTMWSGFRRSRNSGEDCCTGNWNYSSQQEFADDFGVELRTVNRYVTTGIGEIVTIQEIADFFGMDLPEYLQLAKQVAE